MNKKLREVLITYTAEKLVASTNRTKAHDEFEGKSAKAAKVRKAAAEIVDRAFLRIVCREIDLSRAFDTV